MIKNAELFKICGLCALGATLTSGCSVSATSRGNFAFGISSQNIFMYASTAMVPAPAYSVFNLDSSLSLNSTITDSVQLGAYSDSKCTQPALGTISVDDNPVVLSGGVSQFSNFSYTPATGKYEEQIFLNGTMLTQNLSNCSLGVSVIQHFNLPFGYVGAGIPGAAGASSNNTVNDVASSHRIDPNGLYVEAGTSGNGTGQELALWRYTPAGALDPTFGTAGSVHSGSTGLAGATGASENDTAVDFQLDSNGLYVVAGTSVNASGGTELVLLRYNTTGSKDTTFATSGLYRSGSSGLGGASGAATVKEDPKAVILDSQNRLIVVGRSKNSAGGYSLLVARFTSMGALDSSFGTGGIYQNISSTGVAGGSGALKNDIGYSVQLDSLGKLVVVGSSDTASSRQKIALWRLTSSGVLDSTFGVGGVVVSSTSTGAAGGTLTHLSDVGKSLQIDASGNFVVSGLSQNNSGGVEMTLWRFLSSGTLDPSFNSVGYRHYGASGGAAGAVGAAVMDSGSSLLIHFNSGLNYNFYVIAGPSVNASGGTQVVVWRTTFDGALDPTFNLSGSLPGIFVGPTLGASNTMTASTVKDIPSSIRLDSVNTYTVAGTSRISPATSGKEMALWRILSIGTLDY